MTVKPKRKPTREPGLSPEADAFATDQARQVIERPQLGIRMEKRLVKVLKGLAEFKELTLGMLLEEIVLHSFESADGRTSPCSHSRASLKVIQELKNVYGVDYGLETFYQLTDRTKAQSAKEQLFDAVKIGDVPRIERLLAREPTLVHARDDADMTPLLMAARDDHTDVAELLIARGADLEAVDRKHGDSPLGWAAFYGREQMAGTLVTAGANVNHVDRHGTSPLGYARTGEQGVLKQKYGIAASPGAFRGVAEILEERGSRRIVKGAEREHPEAR